MSKSADKRTRFLSRSLVKHAVDEINENSGVILTEDEDDEEPEDNGDELQDPAGFDDEEPEDTEVDDDGEFDSLDLGDAEEEGGPSVSDAIHMLADYLDDEVDESRRDSISEMTEQEYETLLFQVEDRLASAFPSLTVEARMIDPGSGYVGVEIRGEAASDVDEQLVQELVREVTNAPVRDFDRLRAVGTDDAEVHFDIPLSRHKVEESAKGNLTINRRRRGLQEADGEDRLYHLEDVLQDEFPASDVETHMLDRRARLAAVEILHVPNDVDRFFIEDVVLGAIGSEIMNFEKFQANEYGDPPEIHFNVHL